MAPRSRPKGERESKPKYATFITSFSITIIVGVFFKHCVVDGKPLASFFFPPPSPAAALSLRQLQPQQAVPVAVTPGQTAVPGAAQAGAGQAGAAQAGAIQGGESQATQATRVPEVTLPETQLPQVTQATQVPEVTQAATQVPQVTEANQVVPQVTQTTQAATEAPKVDEAAAQKPGPTGGVAENLGGRDIVWQIPEGKVKGVVFIAHACASKAIDFWPESTTCPNCRGLPEESRFAATVVARGFAALAISSKLACWKGDMPASNFEDVTIAADVIQTWREKHRLTGVPATAFGVSSGGYFVSVLAHAVKFDALVLLVSCGVAKAFLEKGELEGPYPPTLFVYMDRDARNTKWIQQNMERLQSVGAHTAQIICKEKPLSETFFSDRIEGVTPELSMRIYHALANAQCVNGTGYLKTTYKQSWESDIASAGVQLSALMVPRVAGELHCAFGFHSMSAEYAQEMVDWLEGVCPKGKPANQRCQKYD